MHHQHRSDAVARLVGRDILALLKSRPVQMFSEIAAALPQYTWHALLSALQQLSSERRIEFVRYESDYEILYETVYAIGKDSSRVPVAGQGHKAAHSVTAPRSFKPAL